MTAGQKPEAMQVIERISREHGAKCTIADASEAEVLKEAALDRQSGTGVKSMRFRWQVFIRRKMQ